MAIMQDLNLCKEDQLLLRNYQIQTLFLYEISKDLESRLKALEEERMALQNKYSDIVSRVDALNTLVDRAKQDILISLGVENHEDYYLDIKEDEIILKNKTED
jgi:UDP-N-acetylmuramyl tripeptide synthase